MAIKAGQLVHVGNQVLVDRAQTAGPGNLNVPTEKIHELGNYQSIATVRDTPDLAFPLESFDVSAELEALLLGVAQTDGDYDALPVGTELDMSRARPLDVVSAFKAGRAAVDPYAVVASCAIPYLTLESISYRFGIRDNASQAVSLRGDSIFYASGSAWIEEFAAGDPITLAHPALPYRGDSLAPVRYALSVTAVESGRRLVIGTDYNEAGGPGAVTLTLTQNAPANERIRVTYQSSDPQTYAQDRHEPVTALRPAAIKGRDIEVRIGGAAITDRWSSIQSVSVEQRLNLEKDEEMGNAQAVGQDADVPAVTGTVDIKPRDPQELLRRIRQIAGVPEGEVVGTLQSVVLPIEVILHSPDTGETIKTIYIPDARFTVPGYSGAVEQKMTITFNWESDGGRLLVYKGERGGAAPVAPVAPEPAPVAP